LNANKDRFVYGSIVDKDRMRHIAIQTLSPQSVRSTLPGPLVRESIRNRFAQSIENHPLIAQTPSTPVNRDQLNTLISEVNILNQDINYLDNVNPNININNLTPNLDEGVSQVGISPIDNLLLTTTPTPINTSTQNLVEELNPSEISPMETLVNSTPSTPTPTPRPIQIPIPRPIPRPIPFPIPSLRLKKNRFRYRYKYL
jgi:hypothetical protein